MDAAKSPGIRPYDLALMVRSRTHWTCVALYRTAQDAVRGYRGHPQARGVRVVVARGGPHGRLGSVWEGLER